jgi:hypothetical protein
MEGDELDRRLREWLQPSAEVIDRVRRTATNPLRRRRVTRRLVATLAVAIGVLVALFALPLRRVPADIGTPFTLETMGDSVVIKAAGGVWVRPLVPQDHPDNRGYVMTER